MARGKGYYTTPNPPGSHSVAPYDTQGDVEDLFNPDPHSPRFETQDIQNNQFCCECDLMWFKLRHIRFFFKLIIVWLIMCANYGWYAISIENMCKLAIKQWILNIYGSISHFSKTWNRIYRSYAIIHSNGFTYATPTSTAVPPDLFFTLTFF
jgi:hypothetical protein